jgi:hypothetical protein
MITIATVTSTKVITLKRSPSTSAIAVASIPMASMMAPHLCRRVLESKLPPPGFLFCGRQTRNLRVLQNIPQCDLSDTARKGRSRSAVLIGIRRFKDFSVPVCAAPSDTPGLVD